MFHCSHHNQILVFIDMVKPGLYIPWIHVSFYPAHLSVLPKLMWEPC